MIDKKKLELAKQQEAENRRRKEDEIILAYANVAEEKGFVGMNDLVDVGFTKDIVTYYFRNLARLNKAAREAHPNSFFDTYIEDLLGEDGFKKMQKAVKKHKRFIVTTAVTGCKANEAMVKSMKNYCAKNNAHVLILVASDPAHNRFAPGAHYGTLDRQLVNDPDISVVVSDIALNSNLCVSTVKLSAKHVDPSTSMNRIASKNGTFIFASPKQRLKAVPVSNKKFPHFTMTTGAVTNPDYDSSNYMSNRTAFIASHDHVMGGLIIEIADNERYHFRQFQIDPTGAFIDLGIKYFPNKKTKKIAPEAFILGDWHSGATDPNAKKSWEEVVKTLGVKRLVMHDLFDGDSINHHERENVISRAKKIASGRHDLRAEMHNLVKDMNYLTSLVNEVIVVKSNHDEFLDRYLMSGYYVKDPQNHRYALDLAAAAVDGKDPLQHAVSEIGLKNPNKVRWLNRDEDYKIVGIQLGAHGDLGANGARGGLKNTEAVYGQSVTGHSHTPEILRGSWQVGTSSLLKLSYNRGASSWLHTSCLLYPDGSRQLINSIDGTWKMK